MPTLGGFIITDNEALSWASRIVKKPISDFGSAAGILIQHMGRNGFDVAGVTYPAGVPVIMVVTQYGPTIESWKPISDDPATLPQFQEGELERIIRKAMEKAGVTGHQFVTSHGRL